MTLVFSNCSENWSAVTDMELGAMVSFSLVIAGPDPPAG